MPDLAVIVPSRGRPDNVRKVVEAWDFTDAWDVAEMIVAVDADDPEIQAYRDIADQLRSSHPLRVMLAVRDVWQPMVHKLDAIALPTALTRRYFAVGFAGDDHLPRTINWAQRYLTVLRELGTGMVYGDDGYQGVKLSTEWVVTADVVRELGRMVPAPVEHMYCDNAIMDMFAAAGALRHLPEIRIEHMHPIVGKAAQDEQYRRVNSSAQFHKDRLAYQGWVAGEKAAHVAAVRRLRTDRPDVPVPGAVKKTTPRKEARKMRLPFPHFFKQVRGATPPEIELTLADMAGQVPADQEIVELGVFQGRTSLIMAWGARNGAGAHVTGVDAWDLPGNTYGPPFTDAGSRRWAGHWVQSLGYSNRISLIQGFAHEVAARWSISTEEEGRDGQKVGLLFVDDDHSAEGARRAIESWAPHLAEGAVIAVDDYGHPDWPGVAEAVDALVAEGVLKPIRIFHDRLAVTGLAGVEPGTGNVTAITSEGVTTSPVNTESTPPEGWVQDGEGRWGPSEEQFAELEAEWRQVDPDGVAALERSAAELTELVLDLGSSNDFVSPDEGPALGLVVGSKIDDLNLGQLRSLARHRRIVLGRRKDLKGDIIQALRDGA